jgi:hypothetical protein
VAPEAIACERQLAHLPITTAPIRNVTPAGLPGYRLALTIALIVWKTFSRV